MNTARVAPKDDPAHLLTMQPLDQRGATTSAIQREPNDFTLEKDGTVPGMQKYGTRVRIWFWDHRELQVLRYRWWTFSHARAMTRPERASGTTRARFCRINLRHYRQDSRAIMYGKLGSRYRPRSGTESFMRSSMIKR